MQKPMLFAAVLSFAASAVSAAEPVLTSTDEPREYCAESAIARAERTIASYVKAWTARDAQSLSHLMTEDAVVDFALDEPGTFLTLEASALIGECATCSATLQPGAQISALRVFPTHAPQAVFVHYETRSDEAPGLVENQLALIEFRGERIARVRNFSAAPVALVAKHSPRATQASLIRPADRSRETVRR